MKTVRVIKEEINKHDWSNTIFSKKGCILVWISLLLCIIFYQEFYIYKLKEYCSVLEKEVKTYVEQNREP